MRRQQLRAGRPAHLMLRQPLPLWKAGRVIEETVSYCRRLGIAEVVWMIDTDAFNHGFTSVDIVQEYLPWLHGARETCAENGLLSSINPWVTLGHYDGGHYRDGPPPEGFHWHVNPDGSEAVGQACPLSDGWRQWLLEVYRLYASVRPDKLWVEDDYRLFVGDCGQVGCYCRAHLDAFAEATGEGCDRPALVSRLLHPGPPDPLRARWFDFQGRRMVEICRELEQVVHRESPATRLGLMNSWSTDGRWWEDAVRALAGPHRPLARPSLGPYEEERPADFIPDRDTDHFKEIACLPPNTEICPELENWTPTPYAKSARMNRLQLIFSQAIGHRAITMSFSDYLGTPQCHEPRVGSMLANVAPMLHAMASTIGPHGSLRGVSIPFPVRYADSVQVRDGQGFHAFEFDGEGWSRPLQASGIPVVYNGRGPVTALTGQSGRALPAAAVEELLRGGLLLDGSAAATLCDRGYGQHLGVTPGRAIDRYDAVLSGERDEWDGPADPEEARFMSLFHLAGPGAGRLYPLEPLPDARAVSNLVDPDLRTVMPGMTLFENEWGGRVAVHPVDLSAGANLRFMSWHRQRQLHRVIRWLGRDCVDLLVDGGASMIPIRRDEEGHTVITVLNIEHDDWEELTITFAWPGNTHGLAFEHLANHGRFEGIAPAALRVDGGNVTARFAVKVPALDALVLRVAR